MKKRFENKVVWITGASSGIGKGLAKAFQAEGAIVAVSARRQERLDELVQELNGRGFAYPLDVTSLEQCQKAAQKIAEDLGGIDIAIANAGYSAVAFFDGLSEEMWRKQFDTNFFGVVWMINAALPYLERSKGQVVIMGSVAGFISTPATSAYNASKFALSGLSFSLYQELFHQGIAVTLLAPGLVASEISQVDNFGVFDPKRQERRPKRFIMPTHKAASDMLNAIYKKKRLGVITGHGKIATFLVAHFPGLMYTILTHLRFRAKGLSKSATMP